ncbi:MAG: fatty acid cis/trans isomerase, partial [Gammaproteobacteria bacterium]
MSFKLQSWLPVVVLLAGCTAFTANQLEQRYGEPEPRDRVVASVPVGDVDYWTDVKPVVEQRCVVCHGCYDAPCQLKMSSIEGIERGGTPARVYKQSRPKTAPLTRLFEDAQTVAEWRDKGFHPVLNEYANSPEANREAGVMYRLLKLKEANPLPDGKLLPKDFDLSLNRDEFCAKPDTLPEYEREHPLQGMPFALPALDEGRQTILLNWLEQGASYKAREPMAAEFVEEISIWEAFLNGDSLKEQLFGRYIYEHLFLAHLYFPDLDERKFFKLVRSTTPPGQPVDLIATRRPFNDPGVERVYYRVIEDFAAVVAKTHMPYSLERPLLETWKTLFVNADYAVTSLPSYDDKSASNPFLTFEAIPPVSRYRFMLERAQFSIMNFIKGPVCRGNVALNEINDRFWVFFQDPEYLEKPGVAEFLNEQGRMLELPASTATIYDPLKYWRRYAKQQKKLIRSVDEFLAENYTDPGDISLDSFWDGDGSNDNATLTVFRHVNSATVEKGLIGRPPKTAWSIEYGLLEKIHYLIVAGYDVYGNVGHQLISRIYMDFLRMEGEGAFLMALPPEARERERQYWYRGADEEVEDYLTPSAYEANEVPQIRYKTDDEKLELYGMLKEYLAPVLPDRFALTSIADPNLRDALSRLEELQGLPTTLMPEVAFVEIAGDSGSEYLTILHNRAHLNITAVFGEDKNFVPEEDTLTVVSGVLGAYPNVLMRVNETDVEDFVG